ncbi:hypothetical protein K470DRAFT_270036 [Piedraia hortae CBS 480.64]|uniref:WD40 repeat-like protein n=1 Tax=Piedraia hortae CBS 480.64 TaxID=1314780 RepID=A0A6A7C2D2_9PEZI|nr:hypothetical protein K470DRAFT_270036 [Piedraia hortae CBS 480.64]
MQFAPVFDVETNGQAEILSLPWAGIRSLLMVAQKDREQNQSILKGIETALDTYHLLNAYFDIYSQLKHVPSLEHLYNNILDLYAHILNFLAHANNTYDQSSVERIIQSLAGEVIPKFEAEHDRMLSTVRDYAEACRFEASQEQQDWVNKQLEALQKAQESLNEGVKVIQQTLDLNAIPCADGAAYDSMDLGNHDHSGELQLCLNDTRVQIIQRIMDWATTANDQRVFWLSGMAGTGKSTIARTIAHRLAKDGYLSGSFFFRRGQEKLDRAHYLFPTLARQMAYFMPSIGHKIAAASRRSPHDLHAKVLASQFNALFEEPLSGYSTGHVTDIRVIVIDALDQCEDWEAIGYAIALWPTLRAHTSMNLRVFVTSRTDNKSKNQWSYDELKDNWLVDKLVDISQPLFIVASTIFSDVRNSNDPPTKLQEWVAGLESTRSEELATIYSRILEQAAVHDSNWPPQFDEVIKPIATLFVPLTIPAITELLVKGDKMVVHNALKPLSSVIDFPSREEMRMSSRATVQIYHESFRDFVMDYSLRNHPKIWIDRRQVHGVLMSNCLNLLKKNLVRDVCKQKDPGTERKAVPHEHVEKHISEAVQYACCNWVGHAINSKLMIKEGKQVDLFLRAYFLLWTEAMAWLDKLGEMVASLKQLQNALDTKRSSGLYDFIVDALRWVPANRIVISDTPLQTYLSALAFAPRKSVLRNIHEPEIDKFLQVWPPITNDWGPVLQTLSGHSLGVRFIAPSLDGKRLVSTAEDETVRLWDTESGIEEGLVEINSRSDASCPSGENFVLIAGLNGDLWEWPLKGEPKRVDVKLPGVAACVSVSPSGRFAAWGLATGDIYIWKADTCTGEVLVRHDTPVWCMTFASGDDILVSGSTEIWKWSAHAEPDKICQGNSDIRAIAISPDGNLVAFWSPPSTVRVFRSDTQDNVRTVQLLVSMPCLIFTPDSNKVLIWESGHIFLCDLGTNSMPVELSSAGYTILAMAFSPDGKTIWAGDSRGSVLQLDSNLVMKSQKQRTGTATIAISTDGRSLASLSQDDQLSLWDTETQCRKRQISDKRLLNFPAFERLILISSDSCLVIVACLDHPPNNKLLLWHLEPNELKELGNKPDHVTAIAISPDNKTLLCGLYNGQIWTFDLRSGGRLMTIEACSARINEIAFSPNGQDFAILSNARTIQVWSPALKTPLVLSNQDLAFRASFSANGRMMYTVGSGGLICEWDVEKACKVREPGKKAGAVYDGSILLNGRFEDASLRLYLAGLEANKGDQTLALTNSSAPPMAIPKFRNPDLWALESFGSRAVWITVNGQKLLKLPDGLIQANWISCRRTMAIPNNETGFIVFKFTGKVPYS